MTNQPPSDSAQDSAEDSVQEEADDSDSKDEIDVNNAIDSRDRADVARLIAGDASSTEACNRTSEKRRDEPADGREETAEQSLRESWMIGPLRPWLVQIARCEIPVEMRGRIDPSDVAQQALVDAWRGESGFRGTTHGQRLAWLKVIVRRVILQQQRHAFAVKRGAGGERAWADAMARSSLRIEELAVGAEPAPEEAVENAEQSLRVAEAVGQLPDEYRRVVEMRHFQDQSHAAIAAQLGKSPAAVRMLWVRALVELRRIANLGSAT